MRLHAFPSALLALGLAVTNLAATSPAQAHDYAAGPLKIGHPWSRATPGGAKVAGGYLTVTNTGTEPDRLTDGMIEAAGRGELHTMSMEGGVMKMAPLADGLAIPPGQTVTLAPSGHHLMFLDLKAPLKKGERVKGTLTFERAGRVPVEFAVESLAAKVPEKAPEAAGGKPAPSGHDHAGHDHGH
ncbi:copper chaperone PCu(A)C [Methylorubrum aminovorans]|nr:MULTISPECIES: copper chaperone PCu(A)C [unclassified Methylobacterium]QIJ74209.1 copper chaperone PCu(A)C [Methylobacterium sp. CLZ]QIJ79113.1 copper chaperone PCu(A)C [Methylobacterium sp. NI91]